MRSLKNLSIGFVNTALRNLHMEKVPRNTIVSVPGTLNYLAKSFNKYTELFAHV